MHRNHTRRLIVIYIAMIAALAIALWAAGRADASVRIGVSDDGAMLATGGIDWADAQGVRDIRFQVRPGSLDNYDAAITDADRHGMRIIISPLHKPDGYPEFAQRIAARWPQIDAISAYNEPEINGFKDDPCGYGRLFRDTRAAVRQVRRYLPVLFGELSPHGSFEWLKGLAKCEGTKVGFTHISFHPYQWSTDPLSPKQVDSQDGHGDWIGIGRLPRVQRWLARKSTMRALGIRKAPKLWITEFGYMEQQGGMKLATKDEIARWWPRAKIQAQRLDAQTLVAQGAVTHHEDRNWNSNMPTGLLAMVAQS